jgi:hypothetical protein
VDDFVKLNLFVERADWALRGMEAVEKAAEESMLI